MENCGQCRHIITGLNSKPVGNSSGYYLFFNIPGGVYTLQVTGEEYYFDEEQEGLNQSGLGKRNLITPITLTPAPSYPFSPSSTLLRGCVRDSLGRGIPGAVVSVQGRNMRTRTTAKGEFVLCFTSLNRADIETMEGTKLVKLKGNDPLLEITYPDYPNITQSLTIGEGRSHHIQLPVPENIRNGY